MEKHHAALDGMVLGEKRVISYRTFSSELGIPTTEAQQCLCEYITLRSEKLLTTWAVTSERESVIRVTLVQGPPPSVKDDIRAVAVWAVAPAALSSPSDAETWIVADRIREVEIVKSNPSKANELRNNRWNQIRSATAGWVAGGAAAQQRERMEALSKEKEEASQKRQSTGLLAKVKAEAADRRKKLSLGKNGAVQFSRPGSKNNGSGNGGNVFAPRPKTADGPKSSSKGFRTLGDALLKQRRPSSEPAQTKSSSAKKGRRIVEESDNEDESSDGEDDELKQERLAMEAEAADAERAEAERAEEEHKQNREPILDGSDADSQASDFLELLEAKIEAKVAKSKSNDETRDGKQISKKRKGSRAVVEPPRKKKSSKTEGVPVTEKEKRTLDGKLGEKEEPAKKKYKSVIVEETEQTSDGYFRTRRVTKYIDEDGNEKPDNVQAGNSPTSAGSSGCDSKPKTDTNSLKAKSDTKKPPKKPRKSKASKVGSTDFKMGVQEDNVDEEGKKGKRKSTKGKKANGSILSFFAKKS